MNKTVHFRDLGLIDYLEAWEHQEKLFSEIISVKMGNREEGKLVKTETKNHLLVCEHPHVFTLGKSGDEKNLLINEQTLKEKKASFYKINRGGDITYHGPGQLVCYPVLDLENFFTDIHIYMRSLEEAVILTLADYGIDAGRRQGKTGVWLNPEHPSLTRKICAMGVRCSRWVTMHGLAFNIDCDLNYFNFIVPCGITDGGVTSMKNELGSSPGVAEVSLKLVKHLSEIFSFEISSFSTIELA